MHFQNDFYLVKRRNKCEKYVFGGKQVHFSSSIQLNLISLVFCENMPFSVDNIVLLSYMKKS